MRDLSTLKFHPTVELLTDILCQQTQNPNKEFYHILISYYLAKMAATMRVNIVTQHRGTIPINIYCINLAPSGQCKGYSTNIFEDTLINQFRSVFMEQTLPVIEEENIAKLAVKRAYIKNEDPDTEEDKVKTEYKHLGKMRFSFDSATTPAIKQMRNKLIMAGIGSVNLEIDEIGINLLPNTEVFGSFLELFDIGKIKEKLTKNTRDNTRTEELEGLTPTNLNAFGTPTKLLDGGKTEETFYNFLEMGYARRCLFGYTRQSRHLTELTASNIFDILTDKKLKQHMLDLSDKFGGLANITNYNKIITMSKEVSIEQIDYQIYCEKLASKMGEHEEIAKAEMSHRYFKALKTAGTYAFIDGHGEITKDNWYAAVCLIEESGRAFNKLLNRDRPYTKLAKYIASVNTELTQVDLQEDLPFYKGAVSVRNDLMQMAIAWGYKNHIVIKKFVNNNIEFITGETLQRTNLDEIIVSYSHSLAKGYKNVLAPFNKLHNLMTKQNTHWINHHVQDGYRDEEHIKVGFNSIIIDVDKGCTIKEAMALLEDYKFLLYTTKRHTEKKNRFRIIFPTNYYLKMEGLEFREFMNNLYEWLPFTVDTGTSQRSRKWLSNPGKHYYNKGIQLIDVRLFIPKTAHNDEQKKTIQSLQALSNLERWFIVKATNGNRNNQIIRYALILVDANYDYETVRNNVLALNDKLSDKLTNKEIDNTCMVTVAKAIAKRDK